MRVRGLVSAAAIALVVATGCGGDSESGTTDPDAPAPVENELSAKDLAAVQRTSADLARAVKARDSKKVCALLDPALLDRVYGSMAKCTKDAGSAFSKGDLSQLEIETIGGRDGTAHVEYKGTKPGALDFVEKGGTWYVTVVKADPEASGNPATE